MIKSVFIKLSIILALLSPFLLRGQSVGRGNYNFLDFNKKNYYFGITLAYNKSNYKIDRSKNFILNDSIAGLESVKGPGFNLQVVSNLKLGENFDIRFLPGFSFAERRMEFDPTRRNAKNYEKGAIESVFVELPFHVRYKSAPYHDKRVFVMGGLKYSYDIQAKSRQRLTNNLKVSPTDFQVEMGAGIQMFFPYFIFSPEIKFSHGIGNILIYQNTLKESNVIERLMSRTFTISFHFEG